MYNAKEKFPPTRARILLTQASFLVLLFESDKLSQVSAHKF
jgi:hypothetical protein